MSDRNTPSILSGGVVFTIKLLVCRCLVDVDFRLKPIREPDQRVHSRPISSFSFSTQTAPPPPPRKHSMTKSVQPSESAPAHRSVASTSGAVPCLPLRTPVPRAPRNLP